MSPELMITNTPEYVGVNLILDKRSIGSAEMSFMEKFWYLNRCFIKEPFRGKGFGKQLITKLQELSSGFRIIVTPGGYNMPLQGQIDFYESCGFKKTNEDYWQWDSKT